MRGRLLRGGCGTDVAAHNKWLRSDQAMLVRRERSLIDSMKFGILSSGIESRMAKAEPGRPIASLAAVAVRWRLMRRCASVWARGNAAPKSVCPGLAQSFQSLEGSSAVTVMGEGTARPVECTTLARKAKDSPVTWETPASPGERNGNRRAGPESPRPCAPADARAVPPRRSIRSNGRLKRGEPERRPMGTGESEDRIGAMTLGKSLEARPRRSKGGPCGNEPWQGSTTAA